MNTANIKQELHNYLEIADDKKLKAIYAIVKDEIKETSVTYTDEFKAELDRRVEHYLNGGKMVSPKEMSKRLTAIRKKRK
ncbi:MAG: hypothetical protein KIT80_00305 [Chitinophagaceae bacterium]|nr:hypothetical protein [Chitinophagaceae bacterium]MCW5925332.1 hypothetical protein [Chitinophagaceae bacterium]